MRLVRWKFSSRNENSVSSPNSPTIQSAVQQALAEDLSHGDVTTNALFPTVLQATASIVAHQPMTVAGAAVARGARGDCLADRDAVGADQGIVRAAGEDPALKLRAGNGAVNNPEYHPRAVSTGAKFKRL